MSAPESSQFSPVRRPVGLETEFGVLEPGNPYANAVVMASRIVSAYGTSARPDAGTRQAVRWDYEGEDPLADLRGGRLERAAAHPSQLTDDPDRPAPSGDLPPAPWGTRPRPSAAEAALPQATTAVLANGARLYVDHAHPEYSSPEVLTPRDALVWDRAGEVIARRAMAALDPRDGEVVLYKNNVDGKGAAYGSHENYLVRRDLPFDTLAAALIPFLVTRPVFAGAGRVGIGQRSERPGFQISQRADYVGTDIALQTTFNRPIVNTRDEPHADAARFRRLHVINGDANRFDVPIYLKVASTDLLLWYLERAHDRGQGLGALEDLRITTDPVEEHWALSHDPTLSYALATARGRLTAVEIQRAHLYAIAAALGEDYGGIDAEHVGAETAQALALWDETLEALDAYATAHGTPAQAQATARSAQLVEWVAKLQLCERLRERSGTGWDDPRLAAADIQWADLRAGRGLAEKLITAGRTRRLVTDAEVEAAADQPPVGTRAAVRGTAVANHAAVVAASWTSLVLDVPGRAELLRLPLPDAVAVSEAESARILGAVQDAATPAEPEESESQSRA
ncbi:MULTISPECIES: depupylase/deamidase Dop [unclassified Actinomyces]|uniref:depupylase/deamidase Dop n=1 Tax=unclassified Actinomyces TaxID=2609248 RepID=UPI0013A6B95F|nr:MULTISPECIES: depupylase/deamidase Dop [unclassified Actinomyces]MBW3068599.1 proteasome accessory factor PafA2 [Actinomyces sp. 594]NDR54044.1 proteasome accessory factor PafA2 [Actinomyces sp. 565]